MDSCHYLFICLFINRLSFQLDEEERKELKSVVNFSRQLSSVLNSINSKNSESKEAFGNQLKALLDDLNQLFEGFDLENFEKGKGMENMEKRAQSIGANFKIETNQNKGTMVTITW